MARKHSRLAAGYFVATSAVLLLLVLTSTMPAMKKSYAIASPPQAPPWLQPGDYIEYNQTYTIGGLTASIHVKDTVLSVNGVADMRIEGFGPHVPNGFPEPGIVSPFDTANQSGITTVMITTSSNVTRTITGGGSAFTTDLTMFVTDDLLVSTNATLDSLRVPDSGSPAVQAWKVDEHALYRIIGGLTGAPGIGAGDPAFVWFEKDTLMKVRESINHTDSNHNYVVSVKTMEDTNIPLLKSALTCQSTLGGCQGLYPYRAAPVDLPNQSPIYTFAAAAALVVAAVVVTVAAAAAYVTKARHRGESGPMPGTRFHDETASEFS